MVCCHGFTGDKVGYNQLTLNLANFMEKSGYGVIRFDFLGSGDSDGDFSTDTFVAGWKEDLWNVLSWVNDQQQLATSPIILYGHSLGGLVVLSHPDSQQPIAGRMVFAPVTYAIDNFREIIFGRELWHKSIIGEEIANFFERGFHLENQFVQDLMKNNYRPIEAAAELSTALLIIHGTLDVVVPIEGSRDLYDKYQGSKDFVELDIDHGAVGAQDKLQVAIGSWLKNHFPV